MRDYSKTNEYLILYGTVDRITSQNGQNIARAEDLHLQAGLQRDQSAQEDHRRLYEGLRENPAGGQSFQNHDLPQKVGPLPRDKLQKPRQARAAGGYLQPVPAVHDVPGRADAADGAGPALPREAPANERRVQPGARQGHPGDAVPGEQLRLAALDAARGHRPDLLLALAVPGRPAVVPSTEQRGVRRHPPQQLLRAGAVASNRCAVTDRGHGGTGAGAGLALLRVQGVPGFPVVCGADHQDVLHLHFQGGHPPVRGPGRALARHPGATVAERLSSGGLRAQRTDLHGLRQERNQILTENLRRGHGEHQFRPDIARSADCVRL